MIKSVKLKDENLCLTAASDGTLRIWDLSLKKCIRVYGDERK
jgi:WD40 repeat protein